MPLGDSFTAITKIPRRVVSIQKITNQAIQENRKEILPDDLGHHAGSIPNLIAIAVGFAVARN
jgi:hypothetical protein